MSQPTAEPVTVTEADLDLALKCSWDPTTCLIAQSLKRHFGGEIRNVDHMSAQIEKDHVILVYDLTGVTRIMRRFDQAYPSGTMDSTPSWPRIARLRASLPVTFHARLVEEIEDDPEPILGSK